MILSDVPLDSPSDLILALETIRNSSESIEFESIPIQLPGTINYIKKLVFKQLKNDSISIPDEDSNYVGISPNKVKKNKKFMGIKDSIIPGITEVGYYGKMEIIYVDKLTLKISNFEEIETIYETRKEVINYEIDNLFHICLLTMKVGEVSFFQIPSQLLYDLTNNTDLNEKNIQPIDNPLEFKNIYREDKIRNTSPLTESNPITSNDLNKEISDMDIDEPTLFQSNSNENMQKVETESYYNIIVSLVSAKYKWTKELPSKYDSFLHKEKSNFDEVLQNNLAILKEIEIKYNQYMNTPDPKRDTAKNLSKEYLNLYDLRNYIVFEEDEYIYKLYRYHIDEIIINIFWKLSMYGEILKFVLGTKILEFHDENVFTYQLAIISSIRNNDFGVARELLIRAISQHGKIPEFEQYQKEVEILNNYIINEFKLLD